MSNTTPISSDNLEQRLIQQSVHAKNLGALVTIATEFEIHRDQGVDFVIRIAENIQQKIESDKQHKQANPDKVFNPFLPYEKHLYIGHTSPTHACVLNKYNVVDHHFLIITTDYHSQDELLNSADFDALHLCLKQIDGLGFYNGGKKAGASQHHKHLQIAPLPLAPGWHNQQGFKLPMEAVLTGCAVKPTFSHAIRFFDDGEFKQVSGKQLFDYYQSLMQQINRWPQSDSNQPSGPYNLLCTQHWMMVVPRINEFVNGVSINSLGFAGGMLVKNREDLTCLLQAGLMQTLIEASG